eukprot:CAMPEP_0115040618 /NCGR_PEP_ID=MMETSP0216-20121206/44938_1 /TAXON_ID=223996 /ORGANISM="Protocruzia adherens, Strain Boccale" /LENGTH=639 /DNA_ID=CAMNT_0002421897 /DNA_START=94 /DNA_END=2014 /DNA_ORIENTATION=+
MTIKIAAGRPSQDPNNFDLIYFTSKGKLTWIHEYLCELPDDDILYLVSQKDKNGRTALSYACYLGYTNLTLYLLQNGGDINVLDLKGRNAFHILAYRAEIKTVQSVNSLKREHGIKNLDCNHGVLNPSLQRDVQKTKNFAIFSSELESLYSRYLSDILSRYRELLLQRDEHERNPTQYAAMSSYTKCYQTLQQLLEFDNPQDTDDFLHYFDELKEIESREDRWDEPRRYFKVDKEIEELMLAKTYKRLRREFKNNVKALIREAVNMQDKNGHSALHIASSAGEYNMVQYLVKKGADPTLRDFLTSSTALDLASNDLVRRKLKGLHEASAEGDEESLKYLINCGGDLDERKSIFFQAPIHKAVEFAKLSQTMKPDADLRVLKTVLDCGADVDKVDSNGWTALHHAAFNGEIGTVSMLLDQNAETSPYSNKRQTPLHLAALANHPEIIKILLQNAANVEALSGEKSTPLLYASKKGNVEALECLLTSGANLYAVDFRGWNALHYASFHGQGKAVTFLSKWDTDCEKLRAMRNTQGKMPCEVYKNVKILENFKTIWKAAREGALDGVRKFVKSGAFVDEQTEKKKKTALHFAVEKDRLLVARFLIQSGASPSIEDHKGKTPMDYAEMSKNKKMMNVLDNISV